MNNQGSCSSEPLPSLSSSASSSWSSVLKSNQQENEEVKPKNNKKQEDSKNKTLKCLDEIQNFDLERINKIFQSRQK
ncbi:hypothetical protein WDU94_003140 [Cyamophila willieti]